MTVVSTSVISEPENVVFEHVSAAPTSEDPSASVQIGAKTTKDPKTSSEPIKSTSTAAKPTQVPEALSLWW